MKKNEPKQGFVFFRNYWDAALKLPKRERAKFIEAVIEQGLDGKEPQLEGIAEGMYALVKCSIESNEKRRRAGRRPAAEDDDGDENDDEDDGINFTQNAELIYANDAELIPPKSAPIIKNKELRMKNKEYNTPPNPPDGGDAVGVFERFWEAYPRKIDRGDAAAVWVSLFLHSEPPIDDIVKAIEKAKVHDSRFREDRYTPSPGKWLKDKPWEHLLEQQGSYDTDDFYKAALERAYADMDQSDAF